MMRFAIASHNRNYLTRRCLVSLYAASRAAAVDVAVVVFDDGSSDGTADAVRSIMPHARILQGDGAQYWAASMAQAEAAALEPASVEDIIVWLNDDVVLDRDALVRLAAAIKDEPDRALICSTRDVTTGVVSYGGLVRRGWHPLGFQLVNPPPARPQPVDTFNGNIVAVPVTLIRLVGGIDGRFSHAGADIEYGLRLQAFDRPAKLLPGTFGTCNRNPAPIPSTTAGDFRAFIGPKGGGNPVTLRLLLAQVTKFPYFWMFLTYANWFRKRLSLVISRGNAE